MRRTIRVSPFNFGVVYLHTRSTYCLLDLNTEQTALRRAKSFESLEKLRRQEEKQNGMRRFHSQFLQQHDHREVAYRADMTRIIAKLNDL